MDDALFDYAVIALAFAGFALVLGVAQRWIEQSIMRERAEARHKQFHERDERRKEMAVDEIVIRHLRGQR